MGEGAGDAETEEALHVVVLPSTPEAEHGDPGGLRIDLHGPRKLDDPVAMVGQRLATTAENVLLLPCDVVPELRMDERLGRLDRDGGETVVGWLHEAEVSAPSTREVVLDQRKGTAVLL
jgi:hypothetical protein